MTEWEIAWASPVIETSLGGALDLVRSEQWLRERWREQDWNTDLEIVRGMVRPTWVSRWAPANRYPPGWDRDDRVAMEGTWSSRHLEGGLNLDDPTWPEEALARGLMVAERLERAAAALPGEVRLAHVFTLGLGDPSPDPVWFPSATHRFHTLVPDRWYWEWESGDLSPEEAFGADSRTVYGGARLVRRSSET